MTLHPLPETALDRLAADYGAPPMKPLPTDPFAMQARVIGALCEDMFDLGAGKSRTFRRVDTLREIARQTKGDSA